MYCGRGRNGERTYDTPSRRDVQCLALLIRGAEVFEIVEGEGDVDETRTFVVLILGAGDVDQSDAVVLIVVGDEGQVVVGVHDMTAEKVAIEALHVVEACGLQHYVCELGRRDYFVVAIC